MRSLPVSPFQTDPGFGVVPMDHDAIVVGAGSPADCSRLSGEGGTLTLLREKEITCGGLVHTFERGGFFFDGGIRAMEDSGMLFPMMKHLGLEVSFVKNHVSLGIEDRVIRVDSEERAEYQTLLAELYPEAGRKSTRSSRKSAGSSTYMDAQYGIDNPVFLDPKEDRDTSCTGILPWMLKYALTIGRSTL